MEKLADRALGRKRSQFPEIRQNKSCALQSTNAASQRPSPLRGHRGIVMGVPVQPVTVDSQGTGWGGGYWKLAPGGYRHREQPVLSPASGAAHQISESTLGAVLFEFISSFPLSSEGTRWGRTSSGEIVHTSSQLGIH